MTNNPSTNIVNPVTLVNSSGTALTSNGTDSLSWATVNNSALTIMEVKNRTLVIDGEVYIKDQSLYEIIAEVVNLMIDPESGELALWLTSENINRREFAKTISEKIIAKNARKTNTNQD